MIVHGNQAAAEIVRLGSEIAKIVREPEYYERDGKQFKMWDPSDQDPRGAVYVPVAGLVSSICMECGRVGGLVA